MPGGPGGPGSPGPGALRGMLPKVRPKDAKGTIRRLWGYLRRQRTGLILVFVLTAFGAGLGLIGPYLIGTAIDKYILPGDVNGLLRLCIVLIAVYAAGAGMNWLQLYMMNRVSQRAVWELRNDLVGRLQKLPLRFFDSKTHGELMSRTTNDVDNISNTLNQSVTQLITGALTLVGALAIMLSLNVWLTLLNLVTVPVTLLVTRKIAGFTRRYFSSQQKSLGEMNGFIEETVSGQKVVATFCREETSIAQFAAINRELTNTSIKAQVLSGMMGPVMNVVNNLGFALIASIGGWMALSSMTSIGTVVSFLNYSRQFSRPVNDLANQFNMIQAAIAGAERVFEVMDTPDEYEDETEGKLWKAPKGEVIFKDVTFGYKEGVPVLKGVSLHARPGDMIALVGPTGAGKTTVVNLLTRFYELEGGSVTVDGAELSTIDKNSLRTGLGIVLQDAALFSDSIRENIRYGKLDASDEEVKAAARLANADSFIRKLPHGYDTVLAAEGSNLSHGQRQLLTIARAILADPAILILDEATSSIDTRTEMHIQAAMRTLMKGRTSFVIAHRLSTIREADQILVIDGGQIIERGTHEELLAAEGFYFRLYTSQFKKVV
ncbi:ABC transporter ATP-binding protein [Paenibacillus sp. YN15]|uniref:ABC transporter ATP-binding protein n=1 Tax=Paenibacillus sp. YN15 TaxID=1742774 RepID=UPI00215CF8E7|nr:ABC transporter ATP-binding protein [Paenibacillus sp. YN15]